MKQIEFNPDGEWRCPCSAKLGEFHGGHHIKIWGNNSQVYEIGFLDLFLTCDKCGRDHSIQLLESGNEDEGELIYYTQAIGQQDVSENRIPLKQMPDAGGFWNMPFFYMKKLMAVLSEKEKQVYWSFERNITENTSSMQDLKNIVAQEVGLPIEIVKKHYDKIWDVFGRIQRELSERGGEKSEQGAALAA